MTLFATHYFELTALADELEGVANVHLDATEHDDELIFMHAVRAGPANQSYGLQVARLAGVPARLIERARDYLRELERGAGSTRGPQTELPLFGARHDDVEAQPSRLEAALAAIEPDELSPRAALDALFRLREIYDEDQR